MTLETTALDRIESALRRAPGLHAYEIADLDPAFRPVTRWFGWPAHDLFEAVALLYTGSDPPTLLCFADEAAEDSACALLRGVASALPDQVYLHASPALVDALPFACSERKRHWKMVLADQQRLPSALDPDIERLGPERAEELERFYAEAYRGNWFDRRMLAIAPSAGLREGGTLIAVAGLHTWSPAKGVAALGNIAVRPQRRGEGLGRRVTGALCRELIARTPILALNVSASNLAAHRCYQSLGFAQIAEYDEALAVRR